MEKERGLQDLTITVKSGYKIKISSFSNQDEGGIIIFGLDEKTGFAVRGVYDAQNLQKKITEQCKRF